MTAVPLEYTGRYSCPACSYRFESLADKRRHLKAEHPRPKVKR